MVEIVAAAGAAERPCDKIVGLLATTFVYRIPNSQLARIEIRQCSLEDSARIQLVAWRSGKDTPAFVLNTDDFGVVQSAARANTFIIETGGATRDQVFVIVYTRGEPKIVLQRSTRGSASIKINKSTVDLIIEGIYAGDGPARVESHRFDLDEEGMVAR